MSEITGYRILSAEETAFINELKAHAVATGKLVEQVIGTPGYDPRWGSIAKTQLQQGFMALIRAVAQPTTF